MLSTGRNRSIMRSGMASWYSLAKIRKPKGLSVETTDLEKLSL